MDAFATYDPASSDLEDPVKFWQEVDDILQLDGLDVGGSSDDAPLHVDATLLQSRMTSFLALCGVCYDLHLDQSTNCDEVLTRLVESSLFMHASITDISDVLITLVTSANSIPNLHLLFGTLLHLGFRHSDVYHSKLAATQLIPRLVHHFWAARYAEEYIDREAGGTMERERVREGEEGAWNIKHVRAVSMGDSRKQREQARDRRLQCKLRDESVTLLYEVCRAQRLDQKDMRAIDASFVNHLFDLVEASRHWQDDSYNYQLIKLIVALNEQFMVSGIDATSLPSKSDSNKAKLNHSNIVITVLRTRLNASNTFSENLIWMLNRASSLNAEDVCMQLLVLKLLYLLFTTRETAHYFYTNDLKVLVDVFIRELSDLPEESDSLRHTYLRVLHPLLTNTQLLAYPYKRNQIRRLLVGLTSHAHLRDISPTTKRLVDRCLNAQWCVDLGAAEQQSKGVGRAIGDTSEEHTHTIAIQSIAGGPRTYVQAQTVTDAEGVEIPLQGSHEPYQGAPSSTASTLAVAAASLPSGPAAPIDKPTTMPLEESMQPRVRDRRVNSVSSPSPVHMVAELPDCRIERNTDWNDFPSRREASGSSTLTVRRDLGQRASSARSAPLSPPSEHQVSSHIPQSGHDVDTDEEGGLKWSDGSGSSSWHLGMASEHQPRGPPRSTYDSLRYGSPLSQDSTEHMNNLTISPTNHPTTDMVPPIVHIEEADSQDGVLRSFAMHGGEGGSSTGSKGHGRRRRPPAPPASDQGGLTGRKKRMALLSSTSETCLPLSSSTLMGTSTKKESLGKSLALDLNSLPNSPRAESLASSREPSPTQDNLPVSRRRRPPPPPVNRATKGARSTHHHTYPPPSSVADTNLVNSADPSDAQNGQAALEGDDAQMDRKMKYLFVSERGYGW